MSPMSLQGWYFQSQPTSDAEDTDLVGCNRESCMKHGVLASFKFLRTSVMPFQLAAVPGLQLPACVLVYLGTFRLG